MAFLDRRARKTAASLVEAVAVVVVSTLLLSLGFFLYGSARQQARLVQAENNLKQIGVALELYFHKNGCYPPQGCDLSEALAPFVPDPRVFSNPLGGELTLGECISLLYVQPSLSTLDSPHRFLTGFAAPDGTSMVALLTAGEVRQVSGLPPQKTLEYGELLATAMVAVEPPDEGPGRTELGGIKYICVKSSNSAGSGIAYQGTSKRLAGNTQVDPATGDIVQKAMDTFEIGVSAADRAAVVGAIFSASIHAADRIFVLPAPTGDLAIWDIGDEFGNGAGDGQWSVAELIRATDSAGLRTYKESVPPGATVGPILLTTTDRNPMSAGWEIELDEFDAETGSATFTLKCKFGLGVDNADKFHQLTRINLSVVGNGATISTIGEEGNKYWATRYSY